MPKHLNRKQVIHRLEAIQREVNFLLADLRTDQPKGSRDHRDYDEPTALAEEIADRWGVDLAPDPNDEIPEAVQARIDRLFQQPTENQ
jgi:hypothetical protein